MSQSERRTPPSSRLILGGIIVVVGVLLLLGNLGWVDARWLVSVLWPLTLVVAGAAMLRDSRQRKGNPWPWVLICGGLWLIADNMDWVAFSFWDVLLPAALVFIGSRLIFRSGAQSNGNKSSTSSADAPSADAFDPSAPPEPLRLPNKDKSPEFIRSMAFMSYVDLHPLMPPFSGGDLSAVMGGIKLDLRDTAMDGDEVILDVFTFWGGIEIFVPPDWTVSSKLTTLIGGFVDNRRPTSVIPTKTLIIRGFNLMSGIELKN